MGYKKEAIKGVSWITLLRVSTRLITFLRLAIVGRLLTPTQFGYFGLASLFLSLLEILTETGINVFLVQEKSHIKNYINAAWCVSLIRGIFLGGIILLSAPYIATFFNAPEAKYVIMLTAIVPFIRGFINPAIITYQKDLLFHKEFILRFILFLIDAGVGILFAFITRDAISFVYGLIASAIVEVVLSYIFIPLWPRLVFEYKKIRYIIQRGWWVTLTGIAYFFSENGDNIVVGKMLGSSALGIYQVAYKFSMLPISEITNVVNQVTFPVYAKLTENKDRLWRAFFKVSVLNSIGGVGLSIIIFLFAELIISVGMGEQWYDAIPVIQVLAIYGALRSIFGNATPLFFALRKQDYAAKMTIARTVGLAIAIVPCIVYNGLIGAGYAMIFSILCEIPILLYYIYSIFKKVK